MCPNSLFDKVELLHNARDGSYLKGDTVQHDPAMVKSSMIRFGVFLFVARFPRLVKGNTIENWHSTNPNGDGLPFKTML